MDVKRTLFFLLIIIPVSLLCADDAIRVYSENKAGGGADLYGDNSAIIPYHVELNFTKLENLESDKPLPYSLVLPPGTEKNFILTLTPVTTDKYSFKYIFYYYKGDPWSARHDDSYLYLFPYAHGTKHSIGQGYNGAATHTGSYALDFSMDTGTPVYAAREGLISDIKEDSNTGGPDEKFAAYGNYVDIYHPDGSFATYVHLKQYGAVVEPGDRVKAGQLIGYSGNTGRSSGPHLHFAVSIPVFKGQTTIPVRFLNYDQSAVSAEQGLFYYATHLGKPAFKIELGQEITNLMYDDYNKAAAKTGKMEFGTENIDNTVLIFVKNGFNKPKKLTIDFTLTNMQPSKTLPYEAEVPALKEIYLLFLRVQNPGDKWYYKYSYKFGDIK